MAKALLKDRKTRVVKGFKARSGKNFQAALALDDEGKVVFSFPDPEALGDCPACKAPVRQRGSLYTCDTGRDCPFVILPEQLERKIAPAVVQALLATGRSADLPADDGVREELVWDGRRMRVERVAERSRAGAIGRCRACPGEVSYRRGRWRCGECSFSLPGEVARRPLSLDELRALLEHGQTERLHGFRQKGGAVFKARLVLDEQHRVGLDYTKPSEEEARTPPPGGPPFAFGRRIYCPICIGDALPDPGYVIAGKTAWGCSRWKQGCRLRVPFEVHHVTLTEDDGKRLFSKTRKTRYLKGLRGPEGYLEISRVVLQPGQDPCWGLEEKPKKR